MIYYSKINNSFYDNEIHIDLPSDVIEITIERHSELLALQQSGKQIEGDENGNPIAVNNKINIFDYVALAKAALKDSDITLMRCIEEGKVFPQSWANYRTSLRNIITNNIQNPLPTRPVYP